MSVITIFLHYAGDSPSTEPRARWSDTFVPSIGEAVNGMRVVDCAWVTADNSGSGPMSRPAMSFQQVHLYVKRPKK